MLLTFIDIHLPFSLPYLLEGGRYPAFNVADCGIVIGVLAYTLMSVSPKPSGLKNQPKYLFRSAHP